MASWRDFLENEGYKKLDEAKHLTEILSKDDPEDDPYKSLYEARSKFKEVKKVLKKSADKRNTDQDLDFVWASVELQLGINYVSTEETPTAEECLQRCLDKMEDYKLMPKGMGIFQDALNQMGILWTGRRKADTALEYFKQAELLYVDYKNQVGTPPWMVDEFLCPTAFEKEQLDIERQKNLESVYTHTLFYFAQVYQQLGDGDISAQYCHLTLQRQLDAHDLDKLEWSLQVATLSQYYMTNRDFAMARHCLACADVIFQEHENSLENPSQDIKEKLEQARADTQRCWVKYALGLLEYSREKLLEEAAGLTAEDIENKTQETASEAAESLPESVKEGIPKSASDRSNSEASKPDVSKSDSAQDGKERSESVASDSAQEHIKTEDIVSTETQKLSSPDAVSPSETTLSTEGSKNDDTADTDSHLADGQTSSETAVDSETVSAPVTEVAQKNVVSEEVSNVGTSEQSPTKPEEIKHSSLDIIQGNEAKRFNLEVSSHEEKITAEAFKTFDEARDIFLFIKKGIENAKRFYKFDYHCPDYIEIVQDHSISFKLLAFYELDLERQCKMHKRRVDMLQEILKELNPQHYLLVSRQLMFEIAETYSTMMDLKLAIIEAASKEKKPTPHNVKKINTLVMESIKYFQEYLNTLKGGKPMYPDQFPENDVRPGLVAMFCMGRLYSKFVIGDVQTRLINLKKSKDCYQFLVDYCARNPSAANLVEAELDVCKELVLLLPGKMEKVRRESEL